jgi:hypothetical protein
VGVVPGQPQAAVGDQLSLPLVPGTCPPGLSGPTRFKAGGRVLTVSECFDTYWRFAAERQRIFHCRAEGLPPPWTADPILQQHKFTSVYRAADRISQHLIRDVIYAGSQDPREVLFRVLLFKVFNRIDTWELLTRRLDARPSWAGYDFGFYCHVLDELRLIELAMMKLPDAVTTARGLRGLYELLAALPSLGPFLAYQYAIDISYSAVTTADENEFVVPGPGALDGISKCFTSTDGLHPADVITWMRDTSPEHFDRLGLRFADLWGRWPTLIDWQNVFCEVSKYTRLSHPHIPGTAGPDEDQATVPSDARCGGLPIPAEMEPAARPHGSPAEPLNALAKHRGSRLPACLLVLLLI